MLDTAPGAINIFRTEIKIVKGSTALLKWNQNIYTRFWKIPYSFRHSSPWKNFSDQEAGWLYSKASSYFSHGPAYHRGKVKWSFWNVVPALQIHCPDSNSKEWLFPQEVGTVYRTVCMGWKEKGMFVFLCLGKHHNGNLSLRSVSKTKAEGMNLSDCLV